MLRSLRQLFNAARLNHGETWQSESPQPQEQSTTSISATTNCRRWLFKGDQSQQYLALMRQLAVGIGVASVIGLTVYLVFSPAPTDPSKLMRVPNMDATPGGDRQRESQRYRETLRQSNLNRAAEADHTGGWFMSVPEGLPARTNAKKQKVENTSVRSPSITATEAAQQVAAATESTHLREPAAPEDADVVKPVPPRSPVATENPFHGAILRQMTAVTQGLEITGTGGAVLIADANGQDMAWQESDIQIHAANTSPIATPSVIASGDILQGEVISLIDSDVAAPVAVRLTSGPYVGSTLIGRFMANSLAGGVLIEFERLALAAGKEITVQAIALDPVTRGVAVQGEINPRLGQRYGPLLVSAFVSGFAANAVRPTTTIIETANRQIATTAQPRVEDSVIAGAGQAANAAAADLTAAAPRTPRIRILPGQSIDILFLSSVTLP